MAALSEFPRATGVGIDISREALNVAKENADRLGIGSRTRFVHQDLTDLSSADVALVSGLYRQFDVILSNPPYIPRSELHLVAPDVYAHEPHLALFADGPEHDQQQSEKDPLGLRMYALLRRSIENLLKPQAESSAERLVRTVLLEIGSETQADAVQELFVASASPLECRKRLVDGQQRVRGLLFQNA